MKTQHVLRRMKHHNRGPQAMFGFLIIIIIINMKYSIIELPPNPIHSIKGPNSRALVEGPRTVVGGLMSETNKQRNKDRQTQPHKSYNLLEGFLGFRALGGLGFTGFDAHTRTKAGKAPHRFMGLGLRTAWVCSIAMP